ncbi:MAG TPA: TetR/AcrR family transcriptional regulator [Pseudomonadales bacterium]|nr:TetR/AcrR family transcriptional regulator [Pseudomonadales bacterium]
MGRVSDAKVRLMDAVLELIWTGSYGSTTIDQICEKAGVKKGSFYYFFESKAELAIEALESSWESKQAELDRMFSPMVQPLDRIRKYCEFTYKYQLELKQKFGRALGCPQFALGAEVSTQEGLLQKKIQEVLDKKKRYLESAIRDAHATGLIHAPDSAAKARMILAYYEGLLTQVRIQNDPEVMRDAVTGIFALLGVKEKEAAAV